MKRILILLLLLSISLNGCTAISGSKDGKDRPSDTGVLKVENGYLTSSKGKSVMLRGISFAGISFQERYIQDETFNEISTVMGCNTIRLALYTWGVGSAGYCTGGNKAKLKEDIKQAVECAKNADMFAIIDWHILQDKNPNKYLDDAKDFFEEMSAAFKDYNNVIYEICNEPNNCTWEDIRAYADIIIPIIRNNDPDSVIIVGTPEWSSRVDQVADDPLAYENLLYSFHFYSASHKEEYRNRVSYACSKNLPVFVTEFGITSSNGGFPTDEEEADRWIDFLEENSISYVMWNFSTTGEPCAAVKSGVLKKAGFDESEYSSAGHWLINTIKEKSQK